MTAQFLLRIAYASIVAACLSPMIAGAQGVGVGGVGVGGVGVGVVRVGGVRVGDHPGMGRVVFDFPTHVTATPQQIGDRMTIVFDPPADIAGPARLPRNVIAITGGVGRAEIAVRPGAILRTSQLDLRFVVDVLDPPNAASHPSATRPMPTVPTPAASGAARPPRLATGSFGPVDRDGSRAPVASPPPSVAETDHRPLTDNRPIPVSTIQLPAAHPEPLPPPVPMAAAQPAHPAPEPLFRNQAVTAPRSDAPGTDVPPSAAPLSFVVSGPAELGAAAFDRGRNAIIVFDAPLPGTPLPDTVHALRLPDATVLVVPLASDQRVELARVPAGWSVALRGVPPGSPAGSASDASTAIVLREVAGRIVFPVRAAGRTQAISDPETGQTLLVGAVRGPDIARVAAARRSSEFTLQATAVGIVVEPVSDRLTLRVATDGFVLSAADQPLVALPIPDAARALANASTLTRRFDFPALPPETLLRRLQTQTAAAAAAPALGRFAPRLDAAQTMIALGLGPEAQALLRLAVSEDPQHVADPDAAALGAIAALVAGRVSEAAGLDAPGLSGTDEIAVWRAARAAMHRDDSAEAAAGFVGRTPLILSYPSALRSRLLPLAGEAMALGGAVQAAEALLRQNPDEPLLTYTRALLARAQGETDTALALFDALANGHDRKMHARATRDAVELRLATGRLGVGEAAEALDRQLYAWRGDAHELSLRTRLADLRGRSGHWRPALTLLRETQDLYPDDKPRLQADMSRLFARALRETGPLAPTPLDLVALCGDNPDLLPAGPDGAALAQRLVERLGALDLPKRAEPVLLGLLRNVSDGPTRATLGARLAEIRANDGNATGALAALDETSAPSLPPLLIQQRALARARALVKSGDPARAVLALAASPAHDTDVMRAQVLEDMRDWAGAQVVWAAIVRREVPTDGALNDTQRDLLLRLAGAASQAGDVATLRALRDHDTPRLPDGPNTAVFRFLTSDTVRTVEDLPRSRSDIALARTLPAPSSVNLLAAPPTVSPVPPADLPSVPR